MNDNRERRGPSRALLLLIPAALIIAKGARRRRAMWASLDGPPGPAGPGYGGHHRFGGGGEGAGGPRPGFRLPPRIEWTLDAWHTRAHEKIEPAEPTTNAETVSA